MALFGLSLIVANEQRSHAYETEVLVPLRQALVLTTDKAAPLVYRAALFAEAHGMTDKEKPTCSPYEVSCAESLVDIASDMASLDSVLARKPFLEVYPQASQVVEDEMEKYCPERLLATFHDKKRKMCREAGLIRIND